MVTDATRLPRLSDAIWMDLVPGMPFGSVEDIFLADGVFWLAREKVVSPKGTEQ